MKKASLRLTKSLGRIVLPKSLRSARHRALMAVLVGSRRDANLTQRQLAKRIGMAPSAYGKIETGERRVDIPEFIAIARALKVDPLGLFERVLLWEQTGRAQRGRQGE